MNNTAPVQTETLSGTWIIPQPMDDPFLMGLDFPLFSSIKKWHDDIGNEFQVLLGQGSPELHPLV